MDAVGALAFTLFKVVGASKKSFYTHSKIKLSVKNITYTQKNHPEHPYFQIAIGDPKT